jgi:hypothetical protein
VAVRRISERRRSMAHCDECGAEDLSLDISWLTS